MGLFDFFAKPEVRKEFYENGKLKSETLFKSGKKHGYEKQFHENGRLRFETEWVKGKQNSEVTSFDDEGNKIKQSFVKMGSYEGPQKEWWPNGDLKADRIMKNDKIFSETTYSSNGSELNEEQKIVVALNSEEIKLYHDNGKLKTQATLDAEGNPHGNCKEWYPSGNIFKDQNFKHGAPHGSMKEYFDNGNIRQEYNFKNGRHHGINNEFYEDGSKNMIVTFKDDKEHGMKEQYYPSGNLETRTTYVDGMIEGVHIALKEDGEVIEEKIMQKGLDITMELMQLMMENNSEHMLKAGLIKAGAQEFEIGEFSQKIYEYYKQNNLSVDSAAVSALNQLLKEGTIDKDFYDSSISALGKHFKY
tara:strand:+ start:280 stop:1359 length:1080 start_codon:yes stop_codon:yes gene_type:complete